MCSKAFGVLKGCVVALALSALSLTSAQSHQDPVKVDFRRDVQPLLRQYCIGCHGPSQQMNAFRLDRRRDAMRGGTITMIAPGNSQASKFYLKLIGSQFGPQMPPTGALRPEQIAILKAWVDQGAEWPDEASGEEPSPPPDPKAMPIMKALRDGDKQAFKRLALQHPKAGNLRGPGGKTPLMQAALYGDAESVRLLLDKGADPNLRNEAGATALMWAVNDLEKTRLLLDRGADVNARSEDSRTSLLIAAGQFGSREVVKLLLDRGADIKAKSPGLGGDMTPVTEAARLSDEALLRLLIERGADMKAAGPGPLAAAQYAQCEKCLDVLTAGANPEIVSMGALFSAPPFLDATAVVRWLARGADVHTKDPGGNTLLMLAASSDSLPVESVKTLIARGADVNARNAEGRSAMDFARLRGATPVVDLLAKAGAKEATPFKLESVKPKPAGSSREAIARSLPLLQKSDSIFLQKSGCVSCHNNTFTATTIAAVRKRGFTIDEQIAGNQVKKISAYIETWRERALQGVGIPGDSDTVGYILLGLAAENHPSDEATDAMARFVKGQQYPDGGWRVFAHRPPIESSDVQVTAVSLRSLQVYGLKARREEYQSAVKRAADWLIKARPQTTEDRVFQLLGLRWAALNSKQAIMRRGVRGLLAEQRSDGGWAQLPSLASDAYATGQALVALREAGGLPATDPAYRKGVAFLVRTQLEDGSWYVKSRAIPFQPFFESGFPHGHDQWVSMAASNWATTALALDAR
ncbi:MAG TPA: ankyrin repeat domain-containing protein [Blastocatellia bacterium]|nr:ankyrin repeat domain-containing protein [Blastocatellia bacterium]